jgi:nitrate/TMAO reductase-like tetraheme cytochrome c subunit
MPRRHVTACAWLQSCRRCHSYAAVATAQAKQQSEAIAALIEERDKLAMELQVRLVNA